MRTEVRALLAALIVLLVGGQLPVSQAEIRAAPNPHQALQSPAVSEEARGANGSALDRFARRSKATGLPRFVGPIANVTAILGRDVRLICTVENLGQYQVAWLKEETKTILSIDTNIIITNYRIFLIPDEEERKWVLHIKDVQESDRGFYQCQVNTNPMRSTSGYLEVVVPPTITESQTSQVAQALEHTNVSIQCKASGHPRPTITWQREDGSPIRLNGRFEGDIRPADADTNVGSIMSQLNEVKSDRLSLYYVDRSMAGVYVCTASNGVQAQASKRVPLTVEFAPKTSVQNKHISVSPGDPLDIECLVEGAPKATSYWAKIPSAEPLAPAAQSQWGRRSALGFQGLRKQAAAGDMLAPDSRSHGTLAGASPTKRIGPNQSGDQMTDKTIPLYTNTYHPHNRIQLRDAQANHHHRRSFVSELPLPPTSDLQLLVEGETETDKSQLDDGHAARAAYLTVKQTPVNSYSYKLRVSIEKMQPEDYGKYSCVAKNLHGSAESQVIVTKANRISEIMNRTVLANNSAGRSVNENDYQHDGSGANYQSSPGGLRLGSAPGLNRVTYDANYLQSIKSRQNNNAAGSSKLQQQKLKSRPRNSSSSAGKLDYNHCYLMATAALISSLISAVRLTPHQP